MINMVHVCGTEWTGMCCNRGFSSQNISFRGMLWSCNMGDMINMIHVCATEWTGMCCNRGFSSQNISFRGMLWCCNMEK